MGSRGLSMQEAVDGRGNQPSSVNFTQQRQIRIKMMATTHGIKSLGNRGRQNDETTHERVGRPKEMEEHMGVVRGFFFIIFSGLTVE
jgi:hypothetical protein